MISDEYAAGFFDGEGSVYAATRRRRGIPSPTLIVCMTNTNYEVLALFRSRWGGSLLQRRITKPRHRPQWQWVIAAKMATPFLRAIAPHVIIKREVVALALQYAALMALPVDDRLDYSRRVNTRWNRKQGDYTSISIKRPEYAAKVIELHEQIKRVNARGFNALRRIA